MEIHGDRKAPPAFAHVRQSLLARPEAPARPVFRASPAERRDVGARVALEDRICAEFREMPGLVLSPEQASRLFAVTPAICARVFGALIENHAMCLTANGGYALARPLPSRTDPAQTRTA